MDKSILEPTAPTIDVPNISDISVMVNLNISKWTARKKDKRASDQVNNVHNARRDASAVHKNLLSGSKNLDAINKQVNVIRKFHVANTSIWDENSGRIIKNEFYPAYINGITKEINILEDLINEFVDEYEFDKISAKANLGDLYDENEYPSSDEIRSKFGVKLTTSPIADPNDFRIDAGGETKRALEQAMTSYQETLNARVLNSMNDIYKRLFETLSNISEKLDYQVRTKDTKKFGGNIVSNVLDIVALMRSCNLTNDTQMNAQADLLENALRGVSPEALRDSSQLRASTKRSVDEVKKQIEALPSLDL